MLARMPILTKLVVAAAATPRAHCEEAPVASLEPPSGALPSLVRWAKDSCLDSLGPFLGVETGYYKGPFFGSLFTENLH